MSYLANLFCLDFEPEKLFNIFEVMDARVCGGVPIN
jgi:hypothetical protein